MTKYTDPSLGPFIELRNRVRSRSDYPWNSTLKEFNEYMDRITGCEVSGKGMRIGQARKLWTAALGSD